MGSGTGGVPGSRWAGVPGGAEFDCKVLIIKIDKRKKGRAGAASDLYISSVLPNEG